MFRLNRWIDPQKYRPNPFDASSAINQDIRQVWFAGVHADVGGGYPEDQSALSKFPLLWMIEQVRAAGLRMDQGMINHLVWGQPLAHSKHSYVPPSATGQLHVSLTGAWEILEWLPKRAKWKEWPERKAYFGLYLPRGEPRLIPESALIHRSVFERQAQDPTYRPINLPNTYTIEDTPPAPVPPGSV